MKAQKIIESSGIFFAVLLIFAAIAFALTTWPSGSDPLAGPNEGNVLLSNEDSSLWTQSDDDIFYSSGNVGVGTTAPAAKLEVVGNIIAANPITGDHVTTKDYVDQQIAAAETGPGSWECSLVSATTEVSPYGPYYVWCPVGSKIITWTYRNSCGDTPGNVYSELRSSGGKFGIRFYKSCSGGWARVVLECCR